MAFIVRDLTGEERKKYNMTSISSLRCAVDEDNNAILLNQGGVGGKEKYGNKYEFYWQGAKTTWIAEPQPQPQYKDKKVISWSIKQLSLPEGIDEKSQELKELIKQAIIAYGQNGCNHIPTFKYDTLKISGLEEEQIIYKVKG